MRQPIVTLTLPLDKGSLRLDFDVDVATGHFLVVVVVAAVFFALALIAVMLARVAALAGVGTFLTFVVFVFITTVDVPSVHFKSDFVIAPVVDDMLDFCFEVPSLEFVLEFLVCRITFLLESS